ncbi:MAG: hypothetical protein GY850_12035 [bacterium]|nr:hypothetical protein [bacterium]
MKIKPSLSEFKQMAKHGNLIPVYQEFLADTETPVSAYLKLRDGSYSYLLESADGGKRWGRYSFIGCKPFIEAVSRNGDMAIRQGDKIEELKDIANPLEVLRDISAEYKPVTVDDLPPFQGGLVGYFNYELPSIKTNSRSRSVPASSPIHRRPMNMRKRSARPVPCLKPSKG